jgi:NADPH:quinone reductase-like Zn-dependent oxidoreductase
MKAAVYSTYGPPDVVRIAEVNKPVLGPGDVLVRIHATTVSAGDWRVRGLAVPRGFGPFVRLAFGVFGPRQTILGTELSGVVETVGADVTTFKPDDAVVAFMGATFGCHAEYRAVAADGNIIAKPDNLALEEAAAMCFGGMTALYFLRALGEIRSGMDVLVVGASGAVGSAAVQLATHFGATVTGVCSGGNVELVRSLGAKHVIDYTREDFTACGRTYDIVLDTVGDVSFATCGHLLKERGRLLLLAAGLPQMFEMVGTKPGGRRVFAGPAKERLEDLVLLKSLAEAGRYRPVVGRMLPLDQIVEAHKLAQSGHKVGSVVIKVAP